MKVIRIILVPYPAQGHITPMLNLASALLNHGLEPVMVVPEYIHLQIIKSPTMDGEMNKILWKPTPDGMSKDTEPPDFFSIETAMENTMPSHLEEVVRELGGGEEEEEDGGGGNGVIVGCMVVDLLASWAIQVASRCGVPAAGFWPAMFATYRLITAIPDMIMAGFISDSVWRIGIRINNGFGQSDIEEGLRMVMEDTEMNERLKKVYEKTMGEEAIFKVELNLKAFVDDATKICYQNCMNSN
ncbi:hypothetical protein FEM48_Zijuj04G0149300 [Ziziphus jujuba var. spinosa]|uniref:Uncharacterized protein n=1 Tax=Ziziphus jujuba var. spinosa TaxID=714518 RepID=A0A978VKI4_ZIZJJ|nr:hypothetical protein FEM48_Zijuj04G0149300 [Ziziphus jujuba var. spinosa]